MEVRATLLPGQKGTKQLAEKYGDRLVCVRYRYDRVRCKRIKTVELVVDEADWIPQGGVHPSRKVAVRIAYDEADLRTAVKSAGGHWDGTNKVWELEFGKVLELGLEERMVKI